LTNKKHFEILQRTVSAAPKQLQMHEWTQWYEKTEWYQWRTTHPRIKPNLSGADLRGMTLICIDFSFANLSGANLSGTSLSNLDGADLSNADLSGADLIEAGLKDADLADANLTGANLDSAVLHYANLRGANFSNACLVDAELWGASLDGTNFYGADLCGTEFSDDIGPEKLAAMNAPRTSESSPLQIAEVRTGPCTGIIGMTICPGKTDAARRWKRDIGMDLDDIKAWGASIVVTLIEDHEFRLLAVEDMERQVQNHAMKWLHLPITDVSVPDQRFDDAWKTAGTEIHRLLNVGERILVHCRGGLGRTGLVAALILVERGVQPKEALRQIRAARPHAIETREQEAYVLAPTEN
jgi:protein-tyrosine phosphatase